MSIERWSQKKRTEGYFGEARDDWEVEASQHIGELYAELDKLQACFATCKVDAEAFRQQAVAIALQRDALKAELDKLRKVVDAARAQHTPHHSMPCAVCAALADLDKGE